MIYHHRKAFGIYGSTRVIFVNKQKIAALLGRYCGGLLLSLNQCPIDVNVGTVREVQQRKATRQIGI